MIPSHIERQVKRILGAGAEIDGPLPDEIYKLIEIFVATVRHFSTEEPTTRDIAMMLTLLAYQSKGQARWSVGTVLNHTTRQEQVSFYRRGFGGFHLVQSPCSGLIWASEEELEDIPVEKPAQKVKSAAA